LIDLINLSENEKKTTEILHSTLRLTETKLVWSSVVHF